MKRLIAVVLIFCITSFAPSTWVRAAAQDQNDDYDNEGGFFSPEQLDNLVAPVALYPDPLLAQVLLAATFPDQVDEADREMRAGYDHYDIDDAPWDVSVKAVAHYPRVLHMMADRINWTTSLGQAYVYQSTDVMIAVQRLRQQAREAGNLATTPQQEVIYRDGYVYVYPAQPRYIYVPVYDPGVVYVRHGGVFAGAVISFGVGLAIGAWLNHDCDWRERHVYYHGWDRDDDDGWQARSRPYVHVTNVYVNNSYRTVVINRTVVNREVDYGELNRYNTVHRDVDYSQMRERRQRFQQQDRGNPDNHGQWQNHGNQDNRGRWENRGNRDNHDQGDNRGNRDNRGNDQGFRGGDNHDVNNRIIQRNINTNDPRIDANRGRWQNQQNQQIQPDIRQPDRHQVDTNRTNWEAMRHDNSQQQSNSVFHGNSGAIDPHSASQRGQESRQQWNRPSTPVTPVQHDTRDNGNARQVHENRGHDNGDGGGGGGHQDHDNGGRKDHDRR